MDAKDRLVSAAAGLSRLWRGSRSGTGPITPAQVFTTIDAPGAGTTQGIEGTYALDINASGDVTGFYVNSAQTSQGFLRTHDGTLTEFDPPGTTSGPNAGSMAFGINDAGAIIGSFYTASPMPAIIIMAGYQRMPGGQFESINYPGTVAAESSTSAGCIGNNGEIAGQFFDRGSDQNEGFIQNSTGQFTTFIPPGSTA